MSEVTEVHAVAQATRRLGWDMLSRLSGDDDNGKPAQGAALSPFSVVAALAMLTGAADEDRRARLSARLGLQSEGGGLAEVFGALFSGAIGGDSAEDGERMVTVANAAFASNSVEFLPSYTKFLAALGADVAQYASLSKSVGEINGWISSHTRGLIGDMLTEGAVGTARIVLVNALAFKGTWESRFESKNTQLDYRFVVGPEQETRVPMMFLHGKSVATSRGKGFTSVRLPYTPASSSSASSVAMIAHLPDSGTSVQQTLASLQARDTPQDQTTSTTSTAATALPPARFTPKKYTKFGFPKFRLQGDASILPLLETLGYPIMGGTNPGFGSRDAPNGVDLVLHRAVVSVDEEGTVAAAATVIMSRSLARVVQAEEVLIFDRPFVFEIVQDARVVLFLGVYAGV